LNEDVPWPPAVPRCACFGRDGDNHIQPRQPWMSCNDARSAGWVMAPKMFVALHQCGASSQDCSVICFIISTQYESKFSASPSCPVSNLACTVGSVDGARRNFSSGHVRPEKGELVWSSSRHASPFVPRRLESPPLVRPRRRPPISIAGGLWKRPCVLGTKYWHGAPCRHLD